jgi:hypothetical protein
MARLKPWHAAKQPAYYTNTPCVTGHTIEEENRQAGTEGKRLCGECKRINARGRYL